MVLPVSPPLDVLSSVLEQTRLRGQVLCRTAARPPWGLRFGAREEAMFHVVIDGACWLVVGKRRQQLAAGDVVLFPRGAAHGVADAPERRLVPIESWLGGGGYRPGGESVLGGKDGPVARVLCGVFAFDGGGPRHPVLGALPQMVHVSGEETRSRADLAGTIASLAREHAAPVAGTSLVVSRLLEVLFVQLLRGWAEQERAGGGGWIGALRDAVLARALSAVHGDLSRDWSLEALAHVAGTSRATLGRRFAEEVGEAPAQYLARARMQEAARLLRTSEDGLAAVASAVGYGSEFAFNRAFRRAIGEPPGAYRERVRAGVGVGRRVGR